MSEHIPCSDGISITGKKVDTRNELGYGKLVGCVLQVQLIYLCLFKYKLLQFLELSISFVAFTE